MEIYRRGRAIEDICAKREYLEKILEEMRIARRIDELRHDRLFESTCTQLRSRIRLIRGDYPNFTFRYDPTGRRHHRGDIYIYSAYSGTFEKATKRRPIDEWDDRTPEYVQLSSLSTITADDIACAVDLMIVQEILNI